MEIQNFNSKDQLKSKTGPPQSATSRPSVRCAARCLPRRRAARRRRRCMLGCLPGLPG